MKKRFIIPITIELTIDDQIMKGKIKGIKVTKRLMRRDESRLLLRKS